MHKALVQGPTATASAIANSFEPAFSKSLKTSHRSFGQYGRQVA
jgi:hypothetical protein